MPASAAQLITLLPDELRADVLMRMASLDEIPPEVDRAHLRRHRAAAQDARQRRSREQRGGVRAVAELFNRLDRGVSQPVLEAIESTRRNWRSSIRNLMFVFDDLSHVDDNGIREIVQRADKKALTIALKGASEEIRERFFQNMSKRAAEMMKEEMEVMGAVRLREVEKAQQEVVAIARKLEEEGLIVTGAGGGRAVCHLEPARVSRQAATVTVHRGGDDGLSRRCPAPPTSTPSQRAVRVARATSRGAAPRRTGGARARGVCQGLRAGRARRRRGRGAAQAEAMLRRLARRSTRSPRCAQTMIAADRAAAGAAGAGDRRAHRPPRGLARSRAAHRHGARGASTARRRRASVTVRLHPEDYAATARRHASRGPAATSRSSPIRRSAAAAAWSNPNFGMHRCRHRRAVRRR